MIVYVKVKDLKREDANVQRVPRFQQDQAVPALRHHNLAADLHLLRIAQVFFQSPESGAGFSYYEYLLLAVLLLSVIFGTVVMGVSWMIRLQKW